MTDDNAGKMIEIQGPNGPFAAYFAPAISGTGPGVVVLQEWWGLVEHIKDICDRLAHSGYTALAPDLYGGKTTVEPDEAATLMMALNIADTEVLLKSAIDALIANEHTSRDEVGIVGFCMGGQLALFAAGENSRIVATANFYGIHPSVSPNYPAIKGKVLGIFAEEDTYASPEAVAALDARLTQDGVTHEFRTFHHMPHAFFNDTRPNVYNPTAAQEAWSLLLAFFDENLR